MSEEECRRNFLRMREDVSLTWEDIIMKRFCGAENWKQEVDKMFSFSAINAHNILNK